MTLHPSEQDMDTSKPRKCSLFNKPAWAKSQYQNVGGGDLFRRSNHAYADMVADADYERKERLAKKRLERICCELSGESSSKRKRSSDGENEGHSENVEVSDNVRIHQVLVTDTTETSLKRIYSEGAKSRPAEQFAVTMTNAKVAEADELDVRPSKLIDLLNDDGEDTRVSLEKQSETAVRPIQAPLTGKDFLEDEEFPELAWKAREKARKKRVEQNLIHFTRAPSSGFDNQYVHLQCTPQPTTPSPPDPTLKILITSCIENTQPLIVHRKLSQCLKDVRLAWAERQGFAPDFTEKIFLTWRGKRLFDVTSCKSLGVNVDEDGHVRSGGDMNGDDEGRIHMEAMTPELLGACRKAKRDAKGGDERLNLDTRDTQSIPEKPEAQIRIILKAKGFYDFKLIVKPVKFPWQ
ncbi:MAG: hypothetical protein Q9163_006454 [Psora crenata]